MRSRTTRRAQLAAGALFYAAAATLLAAVWTQDQRWAQTAGVLAACAVVMLLVGLS